MFDSVLDMGIPKRRLGTGALISIALHAGLLALAVWLSVRAPPEKRIDVAVTFMAARPPPLPPPPPARRKPIERRPVPKKPDTAVQPKDIPRIKPPEPEPPPEPEEEDEGVEGGVEGGVKGGVVGGVLGGTLGGQLGGTGDVIPFGEGMTRPVRLEGHDPVYSREALEAHIEGMMIVKCVITLAGKLENCRIIKPLPHMEAAVLDALKTHRYKPMMFQGRPVTVDYVFNIRLVMPKR